MTREEKLNWITVVVIVLTFVFYLMGFSFWLYFLLAALLIIVLLQYGGKNNPVIVVGPSPQTMVRENFVPTPTYVSTDFSNTTIVPTFVEQWHPYPPSYNSTNSPLLTSDPPPVIGVNGGPFVSPYVHNGGMQTNWGYPRGLPPIPPLAVRNAPTGSYEPPYEERSGDSQRRGDDGVYGVQQIIGGYQPLGEQLGDISQPYLNDPPQYIQQGIVSTTSLNIPPQGGTLIPPRTLIPPEDRKYNRQDFLERGIQQPQGYIIEQSDVLQPYDRSRGGEITRVRDYEVQQNRPGGCRVDPPVGSTSITPLFGVTPSTMDYSSGCDSLTPVYEQVPWSDQTFCEPMNPRNYPYGQYLSTTNLLPGDEYATRVKCNGLTDAKEYANSAFLRNTLASRENLMRAYKKKLDRRYSQNCQDSHSPFSSY